LSEAASWSGGKGRLLWVGGSLRVKGALTEEKGMTVKDSVTAGGAVTLDASNVLCGPSTAVNIGANLPAGSVAIFEGGSIKLTREATLCAPRGSINGKVRSANSITSDGRWDITGGVQASNSIRL